MRSGGGNAKDEEEFDRKGEAKRKEEKDYERRETEHPRELAARYARLGTILPDLSPSYLLPHSLLFPTSLPHSDRFQAPSGLNNVSSVHIREHTHTHTHSCRGSHTFAGYVCTHACARTHTLYLISRFSNKWVLFGGRKKKGTKKEKRKNESKRNTPLIAFRQEDKRALRSCADSITNIS